MTPVRRRPGGQPEEFLWRHAVRGPGPSERRTWEPRVEGIYSRPHSWRQRAGGTRTHGGWGGLCQTPDLSLPWGWGSPSPAQGPSEQPIPESSSLTIVQMQPGPLLLGTVGRCVLGAPGCLRPSAGDTGRLQGDGGGGRGEGGEAVPLEFDSSQGQWHSGSLQEPPAPTLQPSFSTFVYGLNSCRSKAGPSSRQAGRGITLFILEMGKAPRGRLPDGGEEKN